MQQTCMWMSPRAYKMLQGVSFWIIYNPFFVAEKAGRTIPCNSIYVLCDLLRRGYFMFPNKNREWGTYFRMRNAINWTIFGGFTAGRWKINFAQFQLLDLGRICRHIERMECAYKTDCFSLFIPFFEFSDSDRIIERVQKWVPFLVEGWIALESLRG